MYEKVWTHFGEESRGASAEAGALLIDRHFDQNDTLPVVRHGQIKAVGADFALYFYYMRNYSSGTRERILITKGVRSTKVSSPEIV